MRAAHNTNIYVKKDNYFFDRSYFSWSNYF